jgi:hypothetical protein
MTAEMDSQYQIFLENPKKISPGVRHPIGKENLEIGLSWNYY